MFSRARAPATGETTSNWPYPFFLPSIDVGQRQRPSGMAEGNAQWLQQQDVSPISHSWTGTRNAVELWKRNRPEPLSLHDPRIKRDGFCHVTSLKSRPGEPCPFQANKKLYTVGGGCFCSNHKKTAVRVFGDPGLRQQAEAPRPEQKARTIFEFRFRFEFTRRRGALSSPPLHRPENPPKVPAAAAEQASSEQNQPILSAGLCGAIAEHQRGLHV